MKGLALRATICEQPDLLIPWHFLVLIERMEQPL
jgi:hypothetical protein